MTSYYSLWDTETGNSLGTYETEAEALAVVRELLRANGPGLADALDLARGNRDGQLQTVARGAALARLAERGDGGIAPLEPAGVVG